MSGDLRLRAATAQDWPSIWPIWHAVVAAGETYVWDPATGPDEARALVFEAAAIKDAGRPITLEAAAAKYFASEAVGRVADRAVQIFGGAGYIADYGIERLYRDVRLFRIYEGTSQIQQLIIARETIKRGG